jgi:hypothetical protein
MDLSGLVRRVASVEFDGDSDHSALSVRPVGRGDLCRAEQQE